jgi:hypothetical protein
MRKRHVAPLLILALGAVLLTACSGKPKAESKAAGPSLDEVRSHAAAALDEQLPGSRRQQERSAAMNSLLAFLRRPESTTVSKTDWEQPFRTDSPGYMRYFESGKIRLYGLSIPASGVVPPGERVAVQYVPGFGSPQAFELETLPGGQLVGAAAVDDKTLIAAFGLSRGGGYLAYYQRDPRSGEFKPDATAFRGLPPGIGETRLEMQRTYLLVDVPQESAWRPQFDPAHPGRFYINPDVALDWKGKFEVLDERDFTAFQAFVTAANTGAKKEDRAEAWDKAIRKLPAYLQEIASLQDDFADKLPPGSFVEQDERAGLFVRLVSIPAPDFVTDRRDFTVVQSRVGNGMPAAEVVNLPGQPMALRVVEGAGQPGIELVTSSGKAQTVSLWRVSAAGAWLPAPEWFGFLPVQDPTLLIHAAGEDRLTVPAPGQVTLLADGTVQVCREANNCLALRWMGGKLSGAGLVGSLIREVTGGQPATAQQMVQAANALREYMLIPETAGLSASQLAAALEAPSLRTWDLANGTRIIAFPPSNAGLSPIIVQAGTGAIMEVPAFQAVQQWIDARQVLAGGERWLILLGRSPDRAGVLLYRWDHETWQANDAVTASIDKPIGEWSKISYVPGQKEPVRGLYVTGRQDLQVRFTTDGQGVALCEFGKACATYKYDQRWVLK